MVDLKDIMFSVNEYDRDGDKSESGIYLHFGDVKILVADHFEEYEAVVARLKGMEAEIKGNL